MQTKLSKLQKNIIDRLLDKYEASKSYTGENILNQRFSVKPGDFFKDYDSDFADVGQVKDFEECLYDLEGRGLITLDKSVNNVIEKIYAKPDDNTWNNLYTAVDRQDKNTLLDKELQLYQSIAGKSQVAAAFLQEQKDRLLAGKKTFYTAKEAKKLAQLCDEVLFNKQELLERELSIMVLGDSKAFEKTYRSKVTGLIEKYGEMSCDYPVGATDTEKAHILLENYGIYTNPAYIYLKGTGRVIFADGYILPLQQDIPLAVSQEAVAKVKSIQIEASQVMTVENLTSFNRIALEDTFFVYLSGYHGRGVRSFLRQAYDNNQNKKWMHFGDIDPDGFLILEHLTCATGIPFENYMMDSDTLIKYRGYAKPLEKNDIVKANKLLQGEKYTDMMQLMLQENIKLEQEIVSLRMEDI